MLPPKRRLTVINAFPARHSAPHTQTLEPFFIPKLQNRFADFPNLHYSISPEAVHLGDLMRLSVRICPKFILPTRVFTDRPSAHPTPPKLGCSYDPWAPSLRKAISGSSETLIRKENSSEGKGRLFPSGFALPLILDQNAGILTCFPFGTGDHLDGRAETRPMIAILNVCLRLRIDSLMINCCSHETFLHFGL